MGETILQIYGIGFTVIAVLLTVLWMLIRTSGARLRLARLRRLHQNEVGGVQSLSFVLTLPVFIMLVMGIVQATQIMIAQVIVEYAAIATARAAVVWIPAHVGDGVSEGRNRVGTLLPLEAVDGGTTYEIVPGGEMTAKLSRIKLAAVQACMPIAPSRDTGAELNQAGHEVHAALLKAYQAVAPEDEGGEAVSARLKRKLAYSLANTRIELKVFHPDADPPLQQVFDDWDQYERFYMIAMGEQEASGKPNPIYHEDFEFDSVEFQPNELGWQDEITVTVHHDLALLPGPGRLLAKYVQSSDSGTDEISESIEQKDNVYTWPLSAAATMGLEGQKPVIRYEHATSGQPY